MTSAPAAAQPLDRLPGGPGAAAQPPRASMLRSSTERMTHVAPGASGPRKAKCHRASLPSVASRNGARGRVPSHKGDEERRGQAPQWRIPRAACGCSFPPRIRQSRNGGPRHRCIGDALVSQRLTASAPAQPISVPSPGPRVTVVPVSRPVTSTVLTRDEWRRGRARLRPRIRSTAIRGDGVACVRALFRSRPAPGSRARSRGRDRSSLHLGEV